MLLHYLVKIENPKNVTDFDSTSTDCWHVPKDILNTWFNIFAEARQGKLNTRIIFDNVLILFNKNY